MALASSVAIANTGVFEGSGHTIKLVRSEDIQLRSEKVTIIPGRGRFLFNGSIADHVDYECKFVLQNLSKKPVTIQAGFPLTSQFLKNADDAKADDATALVIKYKFIVRDNERTYHVRFVPHDRDKSLGAIFLWDMTFQGDEVRELNVAYEIPMAMALGDTAKDREISYAKDWYWILTGCVYEGFEYVTVTGQSWAGPIESAKFELHVEGFEQYLNDRFVIERPPYTAEQLAEIDKERRQNVAAIEEAIKNGEIKGGPAKLRELIKAAKEPPFDWHVKDRLIHRQVLPEGWKTEDDVITWNFKNYRPREPIRVAYSLTLFPKNPKDVPSFVKLTLGSNPSKDDLRDLREIYLAWYGIPPKSESVRKFVSNQQWYAPKDGMTVDKLTNEQRAVVSAIEQPAVAKKDTASSLAPRYGIARRTYSRNALSQNRSSSRPARLRGYN